MQRALPVAAALLAWLFGLLEFTHRIELQTYDLRVAATARPAAPSDQILLIFIDDESIRRMEPIVGRWPWPRLVHATVIDYLAAAGAKVIGYDILFAERDIRKFMVGDAEWTGEESDAALVESTMKAGNVVHIAEASSGELADPSRALKQDLDAPSLRTPPPSVGCEQPRPIVTPPFPALARASRAIGHSLLTLDADGPVRRVSPVVRVGDRRIPSLAFATTLAAGTTPSIGARIDDTGQCAVMIPWRGPAINRDGHDTFKSYSFYDVFYSQQQIIEGRTPGIDPAIFKDRIVIVGGSGEGLKEVFTTPFPSGEIDGPEVHANLVDAFLASRSVEPAPQWLTAALVIAAVLIVGVAGSFLDAWLTGAVALVAATLFAWQSIFVFARGTWIPVTVPLLALVFAFVGDLAWKYFVEGREKRQVKKLFSRYVSKDVYDQLVANPSLAALGGARRHMTVLFSDIRGFTTMSEKGTPEDVVAQLNQLFTRMVAVVFAHRGTVDKFVGDMVMALYGAPLDDEDHAEHAVQTALAMFKTLQEMNQEWARDGKPQLDIGIGINTGDMIAGNVGSETIMSYTVIGDAVNLGARLESLNKDYGTRIIISDATRQRLKGQYDIHPLGDVIVKGKSKPVAIFEVKPT
ncbi:MAG TPA: adenylate/guanylate cyclase domain-containing protein [Vicinamibacterales bacterium]|nr:adenylate/guanylate cyclase domain-containing protein [Vicinamibacterales bacterium]